MNKSVPLIIGFVFIMFTLFNCATYTTTSTETDTFMGKSGPDIPPLPVFDGPKVRAQVIKFGLDETVEQKYPELKEKRVGWGLCQRIVENLYDSNRFEFLEDKETIIEKMFQQIAITNHAFHDQSQALEQNKVKQPEYYIYAEVYDFAVSKRENIAGVRAQSSQVTKVGIQIRITEVETGSYIPGSGVGEAAATLERPLWGKTELEFDQSTVGIASELAIRRALNQVIERWAKKN